MSLATLPNDHDYRGAGVQCHWVRQGRRCSTESAPAALFCVRHQNTESARGATRQIRHGSVLQGNYAEAWRRNYDDPAILDARAEVALAQTALEAAAAQADFDDPKNRVALIEQTGAVTQIMARTLALEIERGSVLTLAQAKALAIGIGDDINRLVGDPALRRSLLESIGARFGQLLPTNAEEAGYRKELEVAAAPPYYVEGEYA